MTKKLKDTTPFVRQGLNRSFGRTASRMSPTDQANLDERLKPFIVNVAEGQKLNTIFPQEHKTPQGEFIVEVGMGNGKSLLDRAIKNPQNNHLGIEVYKNGLRTLAIGLEKADITNLKICNGDARIVLENLPSASIDQLVVLYPDPWPKNKQKKRRIIQTEFLNEAARVIKPAGELFIATDIVDYAMYILARILPHSEFISDAVSPQSWATPPSWWVQTKYEEKAIREGRVPWYFTFKRKK